MLRDKYNKMLESFKHYYPYFYEQAIDWWPSGKTYITIKLDDGSLIEYDSFTDNYRIIQPNDYVKDAETLRKDIGENLKRIILTRGIAQSEIAKNSGITQAMLSRYIHGTSMPSVYIVNSLASVLGCRAIDIIGESYQD